MTAPVWQNVPLVFMQLPHCPYCGSTSRHTVKSQAGGDGSTSRRTECRDCGSRYVLVLEEPEGPLPRSGSGAAATE